MSIRNSGANSAYLWITQAFDHNAPFTWYVKAKITTDENRNTTFLCTSGDPAQYDGDYIRTSTDGTTVRAQVALNNSFTASGGTNIGTGTYANLTLVRESITSLKIYVDGTLANTVTTDVSGRDGSGALFLTVQGTEDASSRTGSLNGCIAYSIIWAGVALDGTEITAQQDYGHPVVQTGSVWSYSVFSGGNYNDLSGNGRHWTAVGAITDEADPVIKYSMTAAQADHAHTVDDAALTQHNVLAAAEALHAHAADNAGLTQHNILVAAGADHAHTVDDAVLTQHNVLTAADMALDVAADNVTLYYSESGVVVYPDDLALGVAIDSPVLVPHFALSAQDSILGHTVEGFDITQHHILVAANAAHAHTVDNAAIALYLAANEALHGHTAAGAVLTQHNVLAAHNSRILHRADNFALATLQRRIVATATAARITSAATAVIASQLQTHTAPAVFVMNQSTELD